MQDLQVGSCQFKVLGDQLDTNGLIALCSALHRDHDIIDYRAVAHHKLHGGAQVTDAYLAALARHYQGRVATFDRAFAALHPDVVTDIGAP